MNLSVNNNVSFKANLNVASVKGSKTRWENIAKEFARITSKSKDEFVLEGSFTEGLNFRGTLGNLEFQSGYVKKEATKLLKNLSDSDIAKKLKELYTLQKKSLRMTDPLYKYLPEHIDPSDLVDSIRETLVDDKFLKDAILGRRDNWGERVITLGF
jgi:hypothetical protein